MITIRAKNCTRRTEILVFLIQLLLYEMQELKFHLASNGQPRLVMHIHSLCRFIPGRPGSARRRRTKRDCALKRRYRVGAGESRREMRECLPIV